MKSIDQRLHEFRGKKWVDGFEFVGGTTIKNPSYTTQIEPYWELLQELKKHEKWDEFKEWMLSEQEKRYKASLLHHEDCVFDQLLDQKRGCEAIANFFCKE